MCENGWPQGPPKSLKKSKNRSRKGPQTQPCFQKVPQEAPKGSQGRPGVDFGAIWGDFGVKIGAKIAQNS